MARLEKRDSWELVEDGSRYYLIEGGTVIYSYPKHTHTKSMARKLFARAARGEALGGLGALNFVATANPFGQGVLGGVERETLRRAKQKADELSTILRLAMQKM